MSEPFKGTIKADFRDSVPDGSPFEPPKAPEGAPNVVYIVLDDIGFSAMRCYGRPIETPNIDRIAATGVRFTRWHTTALYSATPCPGSRPIWHDGWKAVTTPRRSAAEATSTTTPGSGS